MSDQTREALKQAIATLQEAHAADMNSQSETAFMLYLSARSRLESTAASLPDAHQVVIQRHLESIRPRMDALRAERVRAAAMSSSTDHGSNEKGASSSSSSNALTFPSFPVPFLPVMVAPVADPKLAVPYATVLRPFWLMRSISRSMQSGAYLTPDLYVPKAVWTQDGATSVIPFLGPKVKFLSLLCEALEPLHQQVQSLSDTARVRSTLETICVTADELKSLFDDEVGRVKRTDALAPRSKLERGVFEFLHKGQSLLKSWRVQQDASYNAYLAWTVNTLEQGQALERWLKYYMECVPRDAKHQEEIVLVNEKIHKIAAFFYFGPCAFLLQDMMWLLERYQERSREAFARFLPVEVRIEE